MNSTIFFTTKNKSFYLYDLTNKYLLKSHPIIEEISNINSQDPTFIKKSVLQSISNINESEYEFYYRKYLFLKSNGFFSEIDPKNLLTGKITKDVIEKNLSNIGQVVFQVTNDCNLKCTYCCFGELYNGIPVEKGKMDFDLAKRVFEYLIPYWDYRRNSSYKNIVNIGFYGGEPLLNFNLIEQIVSYCKMLQFENNMRFTYSITTNATLLLKHIDYLVNYDFDLLISLDGDREHDSYRVDRKNNQTFDTVFYNVKYVQKMYPHYFEKKVQFNSILTNRSTVEDIHNYIFSEFSKIPLIDPISITDVKESEIDKFKQIGQKYIEDNILTQKRGTISIVGKELSRFFYYNLNNSYRHYLDLMTTVDHTIYNRVPSGTCLPFGNKIYISSSGNIMTCERIAMKHIIGYANKTDVCLDLEKIAYDYNRYFDSLREQCRSCYQALSCPICIFQVKFENDLPLCPHIISADDYKSYLGRIVGILEEKPELFFNFNKIIFV